jgi:hypothetical protein
MTPDPFIEQTDTTGKAVARRGKIILLADAPLSLLQQLNLPGTERHCRAGQGGLGHQRRRQVREQITNPGARSSGRRACADG